MVESHQLEDIKSQIASDFMEAGVMDVSQDLNSYERLIERMLNSTHFINKDAAKIMRNFCDECITNRRRMLKNFKIRYRPSDFEDDIERHVRFEKNRSEVNNQFRDMELKGVNEILTNYEIITSEQTQNKQYQEQLKSIPICPTCKNNTECDMQGSSINNCRLYAPMYGVAGEDVYDENIIV